MKKLFALLTIATFCGFGAFGVKSYNVVRAENETSSVITIYDTYTYTEIVNGETYYYELTLMSDNSFVLVGYHNEEPLGTFNGTYTKEDNKVVLECNGGTMQILLNEESKTFTYVELEEEKDQVSFFEDISQTAKDTIAVIQATLNQPVVIGGMTMSLGAFLIWLLGKVIDRITTSKKGSESAEKLKSLYNVIADQNATIEEQKKAFKQLYSVVSLLAQNIKNANVKEKLLELLCECEPIVKEHAEELAEDTKEIIVETANDLLNEIINKD